MLQNLCFCPLLKDVTTQSVMGFDPLPPLDTIYSYVRPERYHPCFVPIPTPLVGPWDLLQLSLQIRRKRQAQANRASPLRNRGHTV